MAAVRRGLVSSACIAIQLLLNSLIFSSIHGSISITVSIFSSIRSLLASSTVGYTLAVAPCAFTASMIIWVYWDCR